MMVGKTGSLGPFGAKSLCIAASCPFAKIIPQYENHFGKSKACHNTP